ncbi:PP0621 family protein [Helicobacter sp. MIT 21-1697]|uniref:PP0621 family protein n=1 Tax=Helicobacter sp. MIT 21-1697 TaxID=2993733 RepID=UPI00224AEC84|nr:PP0621 family protein [Helicobacter sp. MIT 21-1697]MCX2717494.1 PP0621 family protein [Helicobacter sp. MIT 21-1697]
MKFLLIVLTLGLLVYLIIRPMLKGKNPRRHTKDESIEEMRECAHCGVYISTQEAFLSHNKYFCSKECMQEDTK